MSFVMRFAGALLAVAAGIAQASAADITVAVAANFTDDAKEIAKPGLIASSAIVRIGWLSARFCLHAAIHNV